MEDGVLPVSKKFAAPVWMTNPGVIAVSSDIKMACEGETARHPCRLPCYHLDWLGNVDGLMIDAIIPFLPSQRCHFIASVALKVALANRS